MTVNWPMVIERNRPMLLGLVAELFALIGCDEGDLLRPNPRIPVLSSYLRFYVLRILRPAESAVRRLILIAARGLTVELTDREIAAATPKPKPVAKTSNLVNVGTFNLGLASWARPQAAEETPAAQQPVARPLSIPPFPLVDPLKRFDFGPRRRYAKTMPRFRWLSLYQPTRMCEPEPGPAADREPDATRICRRLLSLKRALDDIDGQAQRLARWRAMRVLGLQRSPRSSPMRPGYPPGRRKRSRHWIDDILKDVHSLAVHSRDTS